MRINSQKGLTLIGWVIVLFFLGTVLWTAVIMFTIYFERLKVKSALEALHSFSFITRAPISKIKANFTNKLNTDFMDYKRIEYYKNQIKFDRKEGKLKISIEYEIRKPLLFSFDLVGKYKDNEEFIAQ